MNEMMSITESDGSSSTAESDDAMEGEGEATVDAETRCNFDSEAQFWKDKASQVMMNLSKGLKKSTG